MVNIIEPVAVAVPVDVPVAVPHVDIDMDMDIDMDIEDQDPEEIRENQIYAIVNNAHFDLSQPGNQGRYTRSHHFRNIADWDAIFSYLTGIPTILYDTEGFIYNAVFSENYRRMEYQHFPEIFLIPLPPISPHFHRIILNVECVNTENNTLMGEYIPLLVSYHENHPLAQEITRLFYVETQHAPIYQSNEILILQTYYRPQFNHNHNHNPPALANIHVERMCHYLTQPGNDFETFDNMEIDASTFLLADPMLVARANQEIVIPERDVDPTGAREETDRWFSIVFPDRYCTPQQRREIYTMYAADQINIHRKMRIQMARDFPHIPNMYELPELIREYDHQYPENNPVDRGRVRIEVNEFIQQLWDGQNNEDRTRILLMMENIVANEHVIPAEVQVQEQEQII